MKVSNIKRRWLRRIVMCGALPLVAFQYMYLGLRSMTYDFRLCWNYEHID